MLSATATATLAFALLGSSLAASIPSIHPRACAGVELIFAAGTSERGLGIVGTPLSEGLAKNIPGLSIYNVPYSTLPEYTLTVTQGANLVRERLASVLAACPDTEFLISGYSKGAIVVHHTAEGLPQTSRDAVRGIAVFGDPNTEPKGSAAADGLGDTWPINDPVVDGNVVSYCFENDTFCDAGGPGGLDAHLSYPDNGDVDKAVVFLTPLV